MADPRQMDRNLALEAVRVTEAAALAASREMGRGDETQADQVAVDAMRSALNSLPIDATVVIGEGERDEAPMLFIGEKVGQGTGPVLDIALDPLEGTTITAKGLTNALAVIAMAPEGCFLNSPDVYMDKIAIGGGLPDGLVDIDETPAKNLANLAKAKKSQVSDLVVCILDRPRHEELIARVEAVLRRNSARETADSGATFSRGSFEVNFAERRVKVGGRELTLTRTEYELLRELLIHRGKVLTHRMLLHAVWGPDYGEEREYVRVFVNRLRRKLGDDSKHPQYIETLPGVGYRFVIAT